MILITDSTPPAILGKVVIAKARLVKDQRIEVFDIGLDGTALGQIEDAVNILEGQIGTVLSIFVTGGRTLYKSMVESWDLGVG